MDRYLDLVPATRQLVEYAAQFIRREECEEIMAADGETPAEALLRSYFASQDSWIALDKLGGIVAVCGVSREDWQWSCPWLLGTDKVKELWRPFLRTCKQTLPSVLEKYPNLRNWCDARYERSLAWLRWLGFTVEPPVPYGMNGEPFCKFWIRSEKPWVL